MKTIIFSMLLFVALPCIAQHENDRHKEISKKIKSGFPSITRSLGGSFQPFKQINRAVAHLPQYKELNAFTPTIGLGWFKEKNRIIADAGITLGHSVGGHSSKKSSTVRYIGFNANAGYNVSYKENLMIYPLIGLGYETYQAIFYKDNSNIDFNDVLTSPVTQSAVRPLKFRNGFLVYRLGGGISYTPEKSPDASIGIQTGYTGSFTKKAWKSNDYQSFRNAPRDVISQFYFNIVLTTKPWPMRKKPH
ncbi:MAG: hypothetical protein H3C48_08725 [Chitinophagaceae bacterium]|nr:hypothetical protein [Chitinophagaceae bacterium]